MKNSYIKNQTIFFVSSINYILMHSYSSFRSSLRVFFNSKDKRWSRILFECFISFPMFFGIDIGDGKVGWIVRYKIQNEKCLIKWSCIRVIASDFEILIGAFWISRNRAIQFFLLLIGIKDWICRGGEAQYQI